jgi:hypothetical protein
MSIDHTATLCLRSALRAWRLREIDDRSIGTVQHMQSSMNLQIQRNCILPWRPVEFEDCTLLVNSMAQLVTKKLLHRYVCTCVYVHLLVWLTHR